MIIKRWPRQEACGLERQLVRRERAQEVVGVEELSRGERAALADRAGEDALDRFETSGALTAQMHPVCDRASAVAAGSDDRLDEEGLR